MVEQPVGLHGESPPRNRNPGRITRVFARLLRNRRLAHAYLFVGSDEYGRKETGLLISRLLLCDKPVFSGEDVGPCGECVHCRKFDHGTHPDFCLVEPSGAMIKVDQVRDLQREVSFQPLEAKRRICLISDSNRLNPEAANALLKTLEEPPDRTCFLLTADSISVMLPTVVSRCHMVRCEILPLRVVLDEPALKAGCPAESRVFLAGVSDGVLSKASRLLDLGVLGVRDRFMAFLGRSLCDAVVSLFSLSKELSQDAEHVRLALCVIRSAVRDMLIVCGRENRDRTRPSDEYPDDLLVNPGYKDIFLELSRTVSYEDLVSYAIHLESVERLLERNVNRELLMESVLSFWVRKTGCASRPPSSP
ncbi:MAG TPA: hypothetical protein EYP57_02130 [Thermodesulfobacteriaceae bacterium]|nr:hypothetical protein [Thermodesulfobacteriaceae bacterium]